MLKIRLQRVGKKHEPVYRVVVCEHTTGPKSNKNIEILGSYDARDKNETKVNSERVQHWIAKGAQVSGTVNNLLINLGIIKGEKVNALPKRTPIVKESEGGEDNVPKEDVVDSAKEESTEEAPVEDAVKEEENPVEEPKEEKPVEESPAEEPKEEVSENTEEEK